MTLRLPLGLTSLKPGETMAEVMSRIPGTRIDDGGNVQNMIINLAFSIHCMRQAGRLPNPNFRLAIARVAVIRSRDFRMS